MGMGKDPLSYFRFPSYLLLCCYEDKIIKAGLTRGRALDVVPSSKKCRRKSRFDKVALLTYLNQNKTENFTSCSHPEARKVTCRLLVASPVICKS